MTKNRRLAFDRLESRLALTVYPYGFIGPVEADASFWTWPISRTPQVTIQSMSLNAIGGGVNLSVFSPEDVNMTEVVYQITGGAIESQIETPDLGDYTPTDGVVHTPGAAVDTWTLYWDEVPESKRIQIHVTYQDGLTGDWSYSLSTHAPVVSDVHASGSPIGFGASPTRTNMWGQYMEGPVTFTGQVDSEPAPGTWSYLQFVDSYSSSTGTHIDYTISFPDEYDDWKVLDWNSTWTTIKLSDYSKFVMPSAEPTVVGEGGKPRDSPEFSVSKPSESNTPLIFHVNDHFRTWLTYQPSGGIRVAIAKIDWDIYLDAHYNGPRDYPTVSGFYGDPAYWTIDTNHDDAWDAMGVTEPTILEWVANSEDVGHANEVITTH